MSGDFVAVCESVTCGERSPGSCLVVVAADGDLPRGSPPLSTVEDLQQDSTSAAAAAAGDVGVARRVLAFLTPRSTPTFTWDYD